MYYEEDPDRRAAANLLTRDEARRIAAEIFKLPVLLHGGWIMADDERADITQLPELLRKPSGEG
jgi:hypothetical protein